MPLIFRQLTLLMLRYAIMLDLHAASAAAIIIIISDAITLMMLMLMPLYIITIISFAITMLRCDADDAITLIYAIMPLMLIISRCCCRCFDIIFIIDITPR